MKSNNYRIKIKLEVPDSVYEYVALQQIWENEGGAVPTMPNNILDHEILSPLQPGKCFKILQSHLEMEDDSLYYIAELIPLNELAKEEL